MSLKTLSQTRWKVEADRVTLFPYGVFYVLSAAMAIIFAGILFVYMKYENAGIMESLPFVLFLLLLVILFWGYANTSIEFNNRQGIMRKKLMGFIPVVNLPFNQLAGINVISNTMGGYNYRVFKKADKYGKGVAVSSGYSRNDDPNAIAFVDGVVPLIHDYLNQHDALAPASVAPITNYKYFKKENGRYIIKKNKVAAVIFGLLMLAFGIHEFTPAAWIDDLNLLGNICFFIFFVLGGPLIIIAGFTTVAFDQSARTIERKSPIGLGNRTWNFADFTGIQTLRRSINFIYSGTDVQMHFQHPDKPKPEVIVVHSFRRSRNIERFVQELYQIMDQPEVG
ncbi:hypothetical protein HH214_15660 [Mucilaginibacter robiniae]|uniref:Uncharacterized protein n=1 Tax=Mucilaginibacter robiniae TaxID=2728022 RepID=A0A7L5E8K8_9SPHI|nr:hypothetical protein [Mucilaginibacter robiniae]QJD97203.1 hypothetical protein HH214_15660 [Mucilaginibacter robiniae]